jgi:hypothetical protein
MGKAWNRMVGMAVTTFAAALAWSDAVRASGAWLVVNEVRVLQVRTSIGASGPARRAEQMANNLRRAQEGVAVTVSQRGREAMLKAGGQLIARVTPGEARAHGLGVTELARLWARDLNAARRLPPLQLDAQSLRTPPEGRYSLTLVGSRAAGASVRSLDPSVATAERTQAGVVVRPRAAGSTTVRLQSGAHTLDLPVEVLPWAADLSQVLQASVIGAPAQPEAVGSAIMGAVRTRLDAKPGARVEILGTDAQPLPSGAVRAFAARVRVQAPDAYTREGRVHVTVRNEAVGLGPEAELWYCNNPENVAAPGNLFVAPLGRVRPARLLYHHINRTRGDLTILVWARNASDRPARLAIVPGDGTPHSDPVRVGIDAAGTFLRAWLTGSGEIIGVPAGSAVPIAIRRLAPNKTMSGLCTLKLLPGGPDRLLVSVDAMEPWRAPPAWLPGAGSPAPWAHVPPRLLTAAEMIEPELTDHVYPAPFREIETAFDVGGRHAFVRIGQSPIPNATQQRELQGNFGVVYRVRATLRNPTERPASVEVAFEASAGYSGAIFVVDGALGAPRLLQSREEFLVRVIRLQPGEVRRVSLITVPLSGSSYPATLTLRQPDPIARLGR